MALVPRFFPRSRFFDDLSWELFDPFDELDRPFGRNLHWFIRPTIFDSPIFDRPFFDRPLWAKSSIFERSAFEKSFFDKEFEALTWEVPKIPEKYRITVDTSGFSPKSLSVEYRGNKLIVHGREEVKTNDNDFTVKEFKKTYQLPENAETDKLASYLAGNQLFIEAPLKSDSRQSEELLPKIVDNNGSKQVTLSCSLPSGIDPSKINVTCKDRDVVIKAEETVEKADGISSRYYYKRVTLPENTEFGALRCNVKNNVLSLEAPLANYSSVSRIIPVEYK